MSCRNHDSKLVICAVVLEKTKPINERLLKLLYSTIETMDTKNL